ncbi:MAG: Nif3-like dinuclear metal center hexameric protein, partial [Bacteroidota bacterium]
MINIRDIISVIEEKAPLALQEDYDNAGLLTGDPADKVSGVLLTTDVTEEVVREAIKNKINLIIAHHPLIFKGLKKVLGNGSYVERTLILAIKNDIAIYAAHTNLDSVPEGVNKKIADTLDLVNTRILQPAKGLLEKLVVFVPVEHAGRVREALFSAGAGNIGEYDSCSYNLHGEGTFRAGDHASPFVGEKGELHRESEERIETILPSYKRNRIIDALIDSHPYEEPAYDIYSLQNAFQGAGAGMLGEMDKAVDEEVLIERVKKRFECKGIRYSKLLNKKVKNVALCGGSGASLLNAAIKAKADVFLTADFKYHQFFDA